MIGRLVKLQGPNFLLSTSFGPNVVGDFAASIGAQMNLVDAICSSAELTGPPPGSVNVRVGKSIVGPGGLWVPCATEVSGGVFLPGLFEIGPGKKQVCAPNSPSTSADEALSKAKLLAVFAAA